MGHSYIHTAINQSSNLLKSDLLACIAEIYSPIIVAHLDALENIIKIIRDSIKDAEKYLEKIAEFRHVKYPIKPSH